MVAYFSDLVNAMKQIAEARKLSLQTIAQHIGKLVVEGKIDVTEVLPQKKILILQKLFEEGQGSTLTEIKAEAPDDITWDDLRIFKAYFEMENSRKEITKQSL